jgi:hypothetical protein
MTTTYPQPLVDLLAKAFSSQVKRYVVLFMAFSAASEMVNQFSTEGSAQAFAAQLVGELYGKNNVALGQIIEAVQCIEGGNLSKRLQPFWESLQPSAAL